RAARPPKRIKLGGTLGAGQGLVRPALAEEPHRESFMRFSIVRVQLQSPLEFSFGLAPLPLSQICICQQDTWFSKLWIQFQCLPSRADQFLAHFIGRSADTKRPEHAIDGCQTDVSR